MLFLLPLLACTGTRDSVSKDTGPEEAFFEYYSGQSTTTSPDGSRTYAENSVLVRRHVDPPNQQIVEETWYDTDARITTMTRQEGSDVFDARDDQDSFTGTITFSGPTWHYTSWVYDIQLQDGSGSLTGTGALTETTWDSTKTYFNAQGEAEALIQDVLQIIDETAFSTELPAHQN